MRWINRFEDTMRSLLRRKQTEQELEDELRDHMEREMESNIRSGMTPEEAKFAARRLVGSTELYKEECRDARRASLVESLVRDLRYAVRMLRRTPLFTAVAIATLAIGIGANTTVFTFVENTLLRPLPIQNPEQVDSVNWGKLAHISFPNYADFRDRNRVFSGLVAYRFLAANMSLGSRENFRGWGYEATGNYFRTLGLKPQMGRFFSPEDDDKPGAHPVAVISYRCWHSRFADDPHVIGRAVKINGFPFTIIGVAGPSFSGTELIVAADYWVPMSMQLELEPGNEWVKVRVSQNAWIIGRRKPGISRAQAETNLDAIANQLEHAYPNDVAPNLKIHLSPPGLIGDDLRGPFTGFAAVLMGVAGLGLLLACVNLAGMLLARASDRRREVSIRLAIGASRGQLLRQLMTESLLLAAAGGALGFVLAFEACRFLSSWHPSFDIPIQIALRPDATVLCFTMAAVCITTFLFGLTPALQATRIDLIPSLKNEPIATRFRRWSARDLLVTGQIALSVVLVICSVLVVRSLQHALTLKLGFNPTGAVSVSFDLGLKGYSQGRLRQFDAMLLAKASTMPGITSVGIASSLPLRLEGREGDFAWRAERPLPPPSERIVAMVYNISPGYLRTAQTRLVAGRDIDVQDHQESRPVVIVNEALGRLLFGKENPLGKHIRVASVGPGMEIVGIVEDGKYVSLGEVSRAAMFVPIMQAPNHWTTLVARSPLPAQTATALLRKTVLDLDPDITLFNTGSLEDQLALPLFGARMAAIVLGTLGMFAMALAATGLFALMSYAVSRRTREIGIRMALGARRREVLASVLGRTLVLCGVGLCVGALATLMAGRLLSSVLYGVSPYDPITYCAALSLMISVALLACWTPALRAIHIDPVRALRQE